MSLMAVLGFENQDFSRDKLIVSGTPPLYSMTVPTGGSQRSLHGQSGTSWRYPWVGSDGVALNQASTDVFWFGFQYFKDKNNAANDSFRAGVEYNGTQAVGISFQDNTNRITIEVLGVVVATASAFSPATQSFERYQVSVDYQTGGVVAVYAAGDLDNAIVEYTLTAPDIGAGKPNGFYGEMDEDDLVDNAWAMDAADSTGPVTPGLMAGVSISPQVPTGDGNYTALTGTFEDVDELPGNFDEKLVGTSVDLRSSFTKPAVGVAVVLAVKVNARMRRAGSTAGVNAEFFARSGLTDLDLGIQSAPADGDISTIMQTDVAGAAWTTTEYDITEFGIASRT